MVEPKLKNKSTETALSLSRIKTIMKSSSDIGTISSEVLFIVAKSTEMFIHHLTKNAYTNSNAGTLLKYEHLAGYVQNEENLEFLLQIIPQKIKVKEFKQIIAECENGESNDSESTSDSDQPEQSKAAAKKPNKK